MPNIILTEQVSDLRGFQEKRAAGGPLPFWPENLAHVYIKLEFKNGFENASTADDARDFLRSVARAATAANVVAAQYGGTILEVQGSILHVGLVEHTGIQLDRSALAFVADIHFAYRSLFSEPQKRVQGWRMAVDLGKTLVVAGRGVHNDDSYVSLGNSANRPAKHLYSQLAIPSEADRGLKRYHCGFHRPGPGSRGAWVHLNLDDHAIVSSAIVKNASAHARAFEPRISFLEGGKVVKAEALPIAPAGSPTSPSPSKPAAYFGWVMRADLDGFTKRVEECVGDNRLLKELAQGFYAIMDSAAQFVQQGAERMAQLPWAGDNFTAAAVFASREQYLEARPRRFVEMSLDFERDVKKIAAENGFGGWAYGVAGGQPHGRRRTGLAALSRRGWRRLRQKPAGVWRHQPESKSAGRLPTRLGSNARDV
jgi:hypothetical protein